jgi:hypothetical protein
MAKLLTLPVARVTDANGNVYPGAKLYCYLTDSDTPVSVYNSSALSSTHTNPVVADGGGFLPPIFLDPAVTYRFVAKTSADAAISGMDFDPVSVLTPDDIQFTLDADGAATRTLTEKLSEIAATPSDFDEDDVLSDPDGDHTAVMVAFFEHCVENAAHGHIPAGTYNIDWGAISLNCNYTRTAFPIISTDGYYSTIFNGTGDGNAPMISIVNWGTLNPTDITAHIATAAQTVFSFTCSASVKADITVTVDGTATTAYTLGSQQITLDVGAGSGEEVVIYPAYETDDETWMGGSLGGLTFKSDVSDYDPTKSSRHGLMLSGVYKTDFGPMYGEGLEGSTLFIPPAFTGDIADWNADPFHTCGCTFAGVMGVRNSRYTIENTASLALNLCTINFLRSINNQLGGWFGFGGANLVQTASMSSQGGVAFDDGHQEHTRGGAAHNVRVMMAELDDMENVYRINRAKYCRFEQQRIIHRRNYSGRGGIPVDAAAALVAGYWPVKALFMGTNGAEPPNTARNYFEIEHRIDGPGGVLADLGDFNDFDNGAALHNEHEIHMRLQDGVFGNIPDSQLWINLHPGCEVLITLAGRALVDQRPKNIAKAQGSVTVPVHGGTWGTAVVDHKLVFTEVSDPGELFTAGGFMVPYTGLCRARLRLSFAMADGTLLRMGFLRDRSSTISFVSSAYRYSNTANQQGYEHTVEIPVTAGDILYPAAAQGTGGGIVAAGLILVDENSVYFEMV